MVGRREEPSEHVRLTEGETKTVELDRLTAASGLAVGALAERLDGYVRIAPSLDSGCVRVRAGRVVGSIQLGNLRLDVRPRMASAELATLMRYAWGRAYARERTAPRMEREGLDELVGHLLADEAKAIRAKGLARRYERRQERLGVVRGRPEFAKTFPWNEDGMTSIVCSYHLLTADNLDNRLLRATLERAAFLDVSASTRRSLLAHRAAWSTIAGPMVPRLIDFERARQQYDRLSEHYALAHRLGELLVSGRRPGELFGVGRTTSGFKIDMAMLFEMFVSRLLKEWGEPRGIEVDVQASDSKALLDGVGRRYRSVRPDVILSKQGVPVAVVDAKYKRYWAAKATGGPERKISNADLYQLFFYAQRLQVKHGLAVPPAAFIVSPIPAIDERGGREAIADRYRRVVWKAGQELGGDLRLVLLPLTHLLRGRRDGDWESRVEEAMASVLRPPACAGARASSASD